MKPLESHRFYYGLSTYSHWIQAAFPPPDHQKDGPANRLPVWHLKSQENHKIYSKVDPRRVPKSSLKSIKWRSGPQGVHWVSIGCPCAPLDHQNGHPGHPKWSLRVSKIIVLGTKSDPFQQATSQQLTVDRGAGGRGEALGYFVSFNNI